MGSHQLIAHADILAAARWRIRDWSAERVSLALAAAAKAATSATGPQGFFADPVIPEDGRDPFFGACAILVLSAHAAGNADLFYQAGYAVVDARRQARRRENRRGGDALDALLRAMVAELPAWSPALLWAELARRASSETKEDAVLADYDSLADEISFAPYPHAPLREVGRSAFNRRLQRIRKFHMRHPPADVAFVAENCPQHEHSLAAAA